MSVYVHGQSPAAQAQRILDDARAEAAELVAKARREAISIVASAHSGAAQIRRDARQYPPTTKILAEAEIMRAASTEPPAEGRARLQLLAAEINAHHAATAARRRAATMANTPAPAEPEGRAA